ncbi:uncharacterized protein PgNI_03038 [Pyricularia grisea]|uniref:Uncharacterized protein n=1 Tax=Pyricularia grisea TaxID=148305 RepID=A0A6P8B958_PYRGI|nr:uncharacterized protein PgNI_03038 [Pyricularia grisea]TLD12368.1 hypothetical protein PgNI_03038 [Pyricularia grisea]
MARLLAKALGFVFASPGVPMGGVLESLVPHIHNFQNPPDGSDASLGAAWDLDGDLPPAQLLDLVALDGGDGGGCGVVGADDLAVVEQCAHDVDVLGLDGDERRDAVG